MTFNQIQNTLSEGELQVVAVACAADDSILEAVEMILAKEIASFILYDHDEPLREKLDAYPTIQKSEQVSVIHANSSEEAIHMAVEAVAFGKADVLMKGYVQSNLLLKEVLKKEHGIAGKRTLSHVAAFELPGHDRLLFVTDAGMNIQPSFEQKIDIVANGVETARSTGIERPKVAMLAAVETVNPKMEATQDAAMIAKMNERGQIKHCEVDGPLALDNAVSLKAARHKKLGGAVAGQADILVVPQIETGNVLYKSLVFFGQATVGAVVIGAKVPIVLTSRSDDADSKSRSILLALKHSQAQ